MKTFTRREMQFYSFIRILAPTRLTDKETSCILYKFALGMTLRDIAELEEVTYQAIDQTINRALGKLRKSPAMKLFSEMI